MQQVASSSAKSVLGTSAELEPNQWLAKVCDGRRDDDRALLAHALDEFAAVADHEANGTELIQRGLSIGTILHDLEMDAATVAVGVLMALPAGISTSSVARRLGESVGDLASLVERLSSIAELHEAPRDALQTERLRKLLLTMVNDVRAALILLAERLFEMRIAARLSPEEAASFSMQTLALFAPLASRLGIWQVKWELEDLSFRFTQPAVYKDIAKKLAERRVDREQYVSSVVERIREELSDANLAAEVTGRPKHIFSIWRKMQSKSLDFHELFDVRAVRVITDSVADCYAALGVVHGLWQHVPHEFDDYIANPKPNRYQSLHTAVIGPRNRTVEVQIRTQTMHEHAERGVAAHWHYKEGGVRGTAFEERLAWLRRALEWRDEMDEPDLALERLRNEPDDEFIYVLTPQGRVIELPRGATPIDFAYRVHTDIGHRCRGARVDGSLVSLTRALLNGETVEILTARSAKPSRDWLNRDLKYITTRRARAKVRQWFRRQDFDDNVAQGKEAWERELRRLRLADVPLDAYPSNFNLTSVDDLFAALGRGDVHVAQLVKIVQAQLRPEALPKPRRKRREASSVPTHGVQVAGVGDLLTQFARCCAPVPPESIVGYITRGRGVSIHRRNCPNARRLSAEEPARVLEVYWGGSQRQRYDVEINLRAYDRRGLLRDVAATVAENGVDVHSVNSTTSESDQTVTMTIQVDVGDMTELSRLISRLSMVRNVFDVSRGG